MRANKFINVDTKLSDNKLKKLLLKYLEDISNQILNCLTKVNSDFVYFLHILVIDLRISRE